MYTNASYLHNTLLDFKDKSILTQRTNRHQLLYIASGKGHFYIDGEDKVITAGHMILYRPK